MRQSRRGLTWRQLCREPQVTRVCVCVYVRMCVSGGYHMPIQKPDCSIISSKLGNSHEKAVTELLLCSSPRILL